MNEEINNKFEDLTFEEEYYEFDINDPDLTPAQLDYITDMIVRKYNTVFFYCFFVILVEIT
jgi:hypothetical protein